MYVCNVVQVTILIQEINNAIDVKMKVVKCVCKEVQLNVRHATQNIIFRALLVSHVEVLQIFVNFVLTQTVLSVRWAFISTVLLTVRNVHLK